MHTTLRTGPVRTAALGVLTMSAVLVPSIPAHAAEPGTTTTRVSVGADGVQADNNSTHPSISNDGRVVAFGSNARNLAAGDTNAFYDIYAHDMSSRTTVLVSVGAGGVAADAASSSPRISGNGRFVTFYSDATNLVAGDTNGEPDVFVHDLRTKKTVMAPGGTEGGLFPDISDSGRYVTYSTDSALVAEDTQAYMDVYLFDRVTGKVSLVSGAPPGQSGVGDAWDSYISGNGRFVAYKSRIGSGDNGIFLYDRVAGSTTQLLDTVSSLGPISANGRFLTFSSDSSTLVDGDTNGDLDIFLLDRVTRKVTAVATTPAGVPGDGLSLGPDISSDGRYVSYWSTSTNLVADIADPGIHVYRYDRQTGRNTVVSIPPGGKGDGGGFEGAISSGGRFVAYESYGRELVADDTNDVMDVFVTQLY